MTAQLIAAAVLALAAFGSAWQIQDWRYGAKEQENAQHQLAAQRQAAATAVRRVDNVIEAQNAAAVRDRGLRIDAAGARTALVGLHAAAADAMRAAAASHDACVDRAAAIGDVLKESTDRYAELGQKADRHASDVKTLTDAWPR